MSFLFKSWSTQIGEKISTCGSMDVCIYKDGYIFVPQNKEFLENITKRLKTIKHPGILNCKIENDQITCPDLIPLHKMNLSNELAILGIHQLYKTLKFLHTQHIVHGNISDETVFVVNGEFKLFGLDICAPIQNHLLFKANSLKIIQQYPSNPSPDTIDGILLYKLACQLGLGTTLQQHTILQWPDALYDHWLIQASEGLSNYTILNSIERIKVLNLVKQQQNSLPKDLCLKIVIDLINAYLYANGGKSVLTTLLLLLPNISHSDRLNGPIFDLFSTKDIDDKITVLEHMTSFKVFLNEELSEKLLKLISETQHPNPKFREFCMRALVTLSEFCSQKTRDNEVVRLVSQYQMDPEPIIRTNSAIGLGKIAQHLTVDVRKRIVPINIMRGLRDPFPPCRAANLSALTTCCFELSEELCASQLLPIVAPQLVDKDKLVRDQAIKCVDALFKKIKEFNPPSPIEKIEATEDNSSSWGFSFSKYVKSGNTPKEEFKNPISTQAAMSTPIIDKVPVQPLKALQVQDNTWNDQWGKEETSWDTPVPIVPITTKAMKLDPPKDENAWSNDWGVDEPKTENASNNTQKNGWDVDW